MRQKIKYSLQIAAIMAMTVMSSKVCPADLVITEVMSSAVSNSNDWWELTNTGPAAVDLIGYYWDDDGPMGDDGALFPSISIGVNESIILLENSDLASFQTDWGMGAAVYTEDLFGGNDMFSGLSSNGDQIELWDADPNAGPANLVASVVFPAATAGFSFEWDGDGNSLGLSVVGQHGAYLSAGGDVGSPGFATIPEPGSLALLSLAGMAGLVRRRRS